MNESVFPILEMQMNAHGLHISLADGNERLAVLLPPEMVNGIMGKWQAFQDGSETTTAISRQYTGDWPQELEGGI